MVDWNGEGGIRTPGTVARTLVFETSSFSHSDTSPCDFAPRPFPNKLLETSTASGGFALRAKIGSDGKQQ